MRVSALTTAATQRPADWRLGAAVVFVAGAISAAAALCISGADTFFALAFTAVGLALLAIRVRIAVAYGLIWLFAKAFWLRLAFYLDVSAGRGAGKWLGLAPALFLSVVCAFVLARLVFSERPVVWNRPMRWTVRFVGLAVLTLVLPVGVLLVKLGGFERNVFPTMAMAAVGMWVYRRPEHLRALARSLMVFGIVSVGYALWQHLVGLPFWERVWFESLNATSPIGLIGWLTIGPSGLEFRIHSCYYSYTEFFFTTVGIFLLNVPWVFKESNRLWRGIFTVFGILFAWLLGVTLERMPMVMLLVGGLTMWAVAAGRREMRRRLWKSAGIVFAVWLLALLSLTAYLNSGVDKLVRLAELTNPLEASSIQDRMHRQWSTTVTAIAERPWGWGLGSGSQTLASAEAKRTGTYVQPHNEVLQKTLELGLIGGVLFLGLVVSQWRLVAGRLLDGRDPPEHRAVFLGYLGMMAAFLICGMVNLTMSGTMGTLYWTVTGGVWALAGGTWKSLSPDTQFHS